MTSMNMMTYPLIHINQGMVVNDIWKTDNNSLHRWYGLKVELTSRTIRGYLNEASILTYEAEIPLKGYAGLWTKADSVTWFRNFTG